MAIKHLGSLLNSFLAVDIADKAVNNLNDTIVNDDLTDIIETLSGTDVSIAYNEDFGNGNKESEIEETAYSKSRNVRSL